MELAGVQVAGSAHRDEVFIEISDFWGAGCDVPGALFRARGAFEEAAGIAGAVTARGPHEALHLCSGGCEG